MLVELLIAMTFIVVAVGALMASYAASMVSLHRSATEGTALTLADRQIEAYKSLPYASIQVASSTIPASGTDPYNTANTADSTIPSATGQLTGGTVASSCTASTEAVTGCATQTWTGPDNQPYRVDTYITAYTPSGGRAIKRITVAVRRMESGSPSTKIWSRATSEFDQSNPPQ
jgi:Tfp pilus assembly protein PilV